MSEDYQNLKEAAERISANSPLAEELLHFVLDDFLMKPKAEEIVKSGGARFYIVRMMLNNWKSSTSPFYTSYRDIPGDLPDVSDEWDIPEEPNNDELIDQIHAIVADMPWFEKKLLEIMVEDGHNISSLSRETGIPRRTISLCMSRIRQHIKKSL